MAGVAVSSPCPNSKYRKPFHAMPSSARQPILVWDAPTRLFHWLLVALVAAAYATEELNWMDWHARAGDAVLALVLFRVAWGVWGSETARFASFVASPRKAIAH